MADAREVLEEAVSEARLLINSTPDKQRTVEFSQARIRPLVELANTARLSDDGTVPDEVVRGSALDQAGIHRLVSG